VFRALGALCEPPDPAHAGLAAALGLPAPAGADACTEMFVFQLIPYAAAYLSPDGMLGGEAADRVAGFWRALRLSPPAEPDHLAALLGLYAALGERAQASRHHQPAYRDARRALLWEHLLTWVPAYTQAMISLSSGFHAAWARLLREALLEEAAALDPPPTQPLHLRGVPELPETGSDEFIRGLLAPVRSGLLITRRDLADAAGATGLAARAGGRSFILHALISQDRAATFGWLAAHAGRWAERHQADDPPLRGVARHWRARAQASFRVLDQAARRAG
jgi:hypothetical protein